MLKNKWLKLVGVAVTLFVSFVTLGLSSLVEASDLEQLDFEENIYPRVDGNQRVHADHLVWTPVSTENPLGGADDFNAILFERFENFNETGGPVATGQVSNVKIVTFQEGTSPGVNQFIDYVIPRFNVALIASQEIKNNIHIENGDVITQEKLEGVTIDRIPNSGAELIRKEKTSQFLVAAREDLQALNQKLWEMPVTGVIREEHFWLTLDIAEEVNIFELDLNEKTHDLV